MGTHRCDIWEVEYKKGASTPEINVQVHGHMGRGCNSSLFDQLHCYMLAPFYSLAHSPEPHIWFDTVPSSILCHPPFSDLPPSPSSILPSPPQPLPPAWSDT
jgi:hypothetical protein